jgi:hypothetical protein
MATKKATKKSTKRGASKTGAKKASKTGRKGSKRGKKLRRPGEPIIVGGGGGGGHELEAVFINFPNQFIEHSEKAEKRFHKFGAKITRVQITGDLPGYDETSPMGDCRIRIWFD